jgi:integrase
MLKFPRKAKRDGLRKECDHVKGQWDKCPCPWITFIGSHRYVNIPKWAGLPDNISRTRAHEARQEMLVLHRQGKFNPKSKFEAMQGETVTLEAALDIYERAAIAAQWKIRSTAKSYYEAVKKAFGDRALQVMADDAAAQDWELWLYKKAPVNIDPETGDDLGYSNRQHYYTYVKAFFNWAGAGLKPKKTWVKTNPMRLVDLGEKPRAPHAMGVRLTEAEVAKLLKAADAMVDSPKNPHPPVVPMRHFVEAQHALGLRRSDILQIRLEHISDDGVITFHDTKGMKLSKKGDPEVSVIAPGTPVWAFWQARKEYFKDRFPGKRAFVWGFVSGQRLAPKSYSTRMAKVFTDAGVEARGHAFRHTAVSEAAEKGTSGEELGVMFRLRDAKTRERYTHAHIERVKALAVKLQKKA